VPIDRDRERAKRRYVRRQAALQSRAQRARRNQQVVGAVVAVLVVIGGVFALSQALDGSPTSGTPAAGATATSSATRAATPSPSSSAASPTPTKTAKQYAKAPPKSLAQGRTWDATVRTNRGTLTLQLFGDKAPQTVSSFVFLSRDKYYDATPCHRLTTSPGLKVLQCGDPTGTGTGGPGYSYGIENAPADGRYPAGTVAMARAQAPNSNGSQFFLTYADSTLPTEGGGYSIFGKVTKGLDVLQAIGRAGNGVATKDAPEPPKNPVTITSITVEPR
jgi:peptidyl-prolyl cis-trans isomerase B (cyclophilin B)